MSASLPTFANNAKVGHPPNPQTWNRYGYVGNSPLSLTDPSGLCPDCNDHDYGHFIAVEAEHSNQCWAWCTPYGGGVSVNDTLNGMSVSGQVAQNSLGSGSWSEGVSSNGNGSYQMWVSGGCVSATDSSGQGTSGCTPGSYVTIGNDVPIYGIFGWGQQVTQDLHNILSGSPGICSVTFSVNAGAPNGRARVGFEYNTDQGFSVRGRFQGAIGPATGRITVKPNGSISPSVRIPIPSTPVGITIGFNNSGITSVGASANLSKYVSAGVSGKIAPIYTCPK